MRTGTRSPHANAEVHQVRVKVSNTFSLKKFAEIRTQYCFACGALKFANALRFLGSLSAVACETALFLVCGLVVAVSSILVNNGRSNRFSFQSVVCLLELIVSRVSMGCNRGGALTQKAMPVLSINYRDL